jgi:hypothetical protein
MVPGVYQIHLLDCHLLVSEIALVAFLEKRNKRNL